jgi:tricarballylate dehydrogenase
LVVEDSNDFDVVVVGSGVAGLSAAVSAAELGLSVAIVERAEEGEHGGNTRYTEAYLRMKSVDEIADDCDEHLADNAGGYVDPSFLKEAELEPEHWSALMRSQSFLDPSLIGALSELAGPTLNWLEGHGIRFDFLPTAFLTATTPRLLPIGGGEEMVERLTSQSKTLGVHWFFETTAQSLLMSESGQVVGLNVRRDGHTSSVAGASVVLACGGFEGNTEMLARYVGPKAVNLRPVARGGYYNRGEGIRMALDIGAAPCGDFSSYHAEPVDPRSGVAEPAVFTFPYGVLVNKDGQRFTDEAPGTVDAHYESVTRRIYEQRDGIAWLILDEKIDDVPNWKKSLRSDQPPVRAADLRSLAGQMGVDAEALEATISAYNAACVDGIFKPLERDGLATRGLVPVKSNWARPIDTADFLAIPIISANVFTFGGLKTSPDAQVIDTDGAVIPGLYAAGETAGFYFRVYTGATSVLRGAVFGRRAAQHIAELRSESA